MRMTTDGTHITEWAEFVDAEVSELDAVGERRERIQRVEN